MTNYRFIQSLSGLLGMLLISTGLGLGSPLQAAPQSTKAPMINPNPPPTTPPAGAFITAPTSTTQLSGQAISFKSATDEGTTFSWTFGDGGTSTLQNPTHTYASAGTYTVKVTISAAGCSSSAASLTLTVLAPVTIGSLTASPTTVRAGTPTTLAWSTTNATTLSLSGVGTVTGTTSKVVSPTATTTYVLTASNAASSVTKSVTVSAYTVGVSVSPTSATIPVGGSQTFAGTVTPANQGVQWSWSGGSGGGSISGSTFTGLKSGPYTVTATSLEDNTKSASATVTVQAVGVSTPSPANGSVMLGSSLQYSASVTGATNIGVNWVVTGGSVLGGASISSTGLFTSRASGSYTVTAISNADTTKSASTTVTVQSTVIMAPLASSPVTGITPVGGPVNLSTSISGTTNTGVTWSVSGGGTLTTTGPLTCLFTSNAAGSYTVTATSVADLAKNASTTVSGVIPVGPPGYTWCAVEGGSFTVNGTCNIAYGANGKFVYQSNQSGTIAFNNTVFGDPIPGVVKAGFYFEVSPWVLHWKKDVIYLGTKEVAEIDNTGTQVTLVDHLGTPRYEVRSDNSVLLQKYAPYGESLTDPTTMSQFAKGFTNHEQTDPSGLIYMQARVYAPMYGRFLSPDPARDQHFEETQSWNIYSYVQNNPTMKIDPTGMVGEELPMFINALTWLYSKPSSSAQAGTKGYPGAETNLKRAEALVRADRPVGDGECPQFVKAATGNEGNSTKGWYGTEPVLGSGAKAGTPIMTPDKDGFYPQNPKDEKHTAVLAADATSKTEIEVFHQWAPRSGPPPRPGRNPHKDPIKDNKGKGKRQKDASQYVIIKDFKKKRDEK